LLRWVGISAWFRFSAWSGIDFDAIDAEIRAEA
jgi:hypothetical protein